MVKSRAEDLLVPESRPLHWLLNSDEPWTRYRTLVDLVDRPESDPDVATARAAMLAHPQVRGLITTASSWPGGPIKRHNDASHALHQLTVLADMGVRENDPGMTKVVQAAMAHMSSEGALLSLVNIASAFGGTGQDTWTWMMCDAPALLYALVLFHEAANGTSPASRGSAVPEAQWVGDMRAGATSATLPPALANAANHLSSLAFENGWHCTGGPEVGKFRGPGKRADPCPIANVLALKALARVPAPYPAAAIRNGVEMLLTHWEGSQVARGVRGGSVSGTGVSSAKPYLFGCGSNYRKLKYPFIWYDILHVLEALSPYPFVHRDPRFQEMLGAVTAQADANGRYTAGAMYMPWKGWSFANKKEPSPWLTFLVLRLQRRTINVKTQRDQDMADRSLGSGPWSSGISRIVTGSETQP
jgi:hypothetical protein